MTEIFQLLQGKASTLREMAQKSLFSREEIERLRELGILKGAEKGAPGGEADQHGGVGE